MSMGKKSFLDKITGKKAPEVVLPQPIKAESDIQEVTDEIDHLWMKEDLDAKKPTLEKDPRIDTGILRNRIADKLAKINNS